MGRAVHPATAVEELTARRSWDGPVLAGGVLTPDLAAFCQSGISIVLASCGPNGWPVAGRALGCRIDGAGRVRVFLRQATNRPLLDAVRAGGGLSASFSKPKTHRTIQLRAARAEVGGLEREDGVLVETQAAAFRDELIDVGYTLSFATIYLAFDPDELASLGFVPEEAFVQTPGPSAGDVLR